MKIELGKIKKRGIEAIVNNKDVYSEYHFIKKLILNSNTYPELQIEQLDLCPDSKEEFSIWLKICVPVTKDELFELLKVANADTNCELNGDEEYPAKITIETFPRKKDLEKE